MITVGTALDQGRDVYAVPGEMGSSTSLGTNRLLRDGAGIVISPEELIENLGLVSVPAPVPADPILAQLTGEGLTPGELSLKTGEPVTLLRQRLLQLELSGRVIRRPGNRFAGV